MSATTLPFVTDKQIRKQAEWDSLINDLVVNNDIPYSADDSDLLRGIAEIVEFCGGTMPFTICTLCGSTDDWHNNNNAECN